MSRTVISTPIHVGAGPAQPEGFADFFDGISAVSHRVSFEIDDVARTIVIRWPGALPLVWAIDELREIPDQADQNKLVLTSMTRPLARLILFGETEIAVLRHRAPKLTAKPPVRGKGRVTIGDSDGISDHATHVMGTVGKLSVANGSTWSLLDRRVSPRRSANWPSTISY